MKLVDNAGSALRWFSVQAMALQATALSVWLAMPEDMKATIPDDLVAGGAVLLAVLGIIGRLIDQSGEKS